MSEPKQNSPEWLEWRKEGVGASDAPVIMGVSPYSTPYQLWQRKLGVLKEQDDNWAMEQGRRKEPLALAELQEKTGLLFSPKTMTHPSKPWMRASLDGMDIDGNVIAEIKCFGKENHELACAGKIPEQCYPQLQHQLEVCQMEKIIYFSYYEAVGVIVEVWRDDKYIKGMVAKEEEFVDCMQNLVAPKLSSKDYREIQDERWIKLANEWRQINDQISSLEEKEKKLKESLISIAGDHNACGAGIKLSKQMRQGNVDYGKIPVLKEINLDDYRKSPTEYWKILKG